MGIYPKSLERGDEIRVIAPSRSLSLISQELRAMANQRFDDLGLKLSFGKHAEEKDIFSSSSLKNRLEDLHEAFGDKKVKAIITCIGGFNSNQLLDHIDWQLLKGNPKIFCGYSDITILLNSIYHKTGLVTYHGPHYSSFGEKYNFEYTLTSFIQCLFGKNQFKIEAASKWSNDDWRRNPENRELIDNEGWWIIQDGQCEGTILGGNLNTFNLLQGTDYFPHFNRDTVLFLEDDGSFKNFSAVEFDRNLQSLIQQANFSRVKGLVIGRFEKTSEMTKMKIELIVKSKKELHDIPIIANLDFGHTTPLATFPIGGYAMINTGLLSIEVGERFNQK